MSFEAGRLLIVIVHSLSEGHYSGGNAPLAWTIDDTHDRARSSSFRSSFCGVCGMVGQLSNKVAKYNAKLDLSRREDTIKCATLCTVRGEGGIDSCISVGPFRLLERWEDAPR